MLLGERLLGGNADDDPAAGGQADLTEEHGALRGVRDGPGRFACGSGQAGDDLQRGGVRGAQGALLDLRGHVSVEREQGVQGRAHVGGGRGLPPHPGQQPGEPGVLLAYPVRLGRGTGRQAQAAGPPALALAGVGGSTGSFAVYGRGHAVPFPVSAMWLHIASSVGVQSSST